MSSFREVYPPREPRRRDEPPEEELTVIALPLLPLAELIARAEPIRDGCSELAGVLKAAGVERPDPDTCVGVLA